MSNAKNRVETTFSTTEKRVEDNTPSGVFTGEL